MALSRFASAQAELKCRDCEVSFRLFDVDGAGEISVAEMEWTLANLRDSISPEAALEQLAIAHLSGSLDIHACRASLLGQAGSDLGRSPCEKFDLVDWDGRDCLSPEELAVLLSMFDDSCDVHQYLLALLRAQDADGSGTITDGEVLKVPSDQ